MSASVKDKVLLERNPSSGYSGIEEHSGPWHSFLEYSTCLVFPVLFGLNVHWATARLYELELLWLVALAIPLGAVGGDLVSGVVHWAADTYCSEKTPIVGPSLVKPFRMHHIYPRDICRHNLVETVGNVCILAVPVLGLCLYLMWIMPQSGWLAFTVVCVALVTVATVATNQFHKWAHQEHPSTVARWLQRTRLVLEPAHHQLHHTEPFNKHYCITNGWLNPLLNKIQFFRRLEATLTFVGIETAKAKDKRLSRTTTAE
ncbi:MAG TPA: kua-ubiquitin conjugating enzyme hybrid localization domain protein [Blastocatellia bacterium]|jgi:ubiquitin-conjugating enzyme E2 variant|nr:kua-ubiquitin conjugating enzyme hybrid localization domain protein [Blastocatellia bacterium]